MLRRGFPKRGRRFMSRKAIITGRAFAGNELPAKSPLCPERNQAFTQKSKQALRGLARPARPARYGVSGRGCGSALERAGLYAF